MTMRRAPALPLASALLGRGRSLWSVRPRSGTETAVALHRRGLAAAAAGKKKKADSRISADSNSSAAEQGAALQHALKRIEQSFGKGAVMRLGDRPAAGPIDVISTGSLGLDLALGVGGLPRGRIVEIYGPESSGKTTLALHVIANAQKLGGRCTFVDAEHALDPTHARSVGVNTDELYVAQPDSGEQALEITDTLLRSGTMDVIVVDSVAALTPRAELEGEMGDQHIALQARLMSQALRKITSTVSRTGTLLIFLNQIRFKVGVIFGSPEVTSGGNALKFFSSVRLDIRRTGVIKDGDRVVGANTRVKVVKNKVSPPFRQAEFEVRFGQGINRLGEILDIGVTNGVLTRRGAYYSTNDPDIFGTEVINLGQGRHQSAQFLEAQPELRDKIERAVLGRPVLYSGGADSADEGGGGDDVDVDAGAGATDDDDEDASDDSSVANDEDGLEDSVNASSPSGDEQGVDSVTPLPEVKPRAARTALQ